MGTGASDLRPGSIHEFRKYGKKVEGHAMKVLITGATGFVGRMLATHLRRVGHEVDEFRRPSDWNPDSGFINPSRLEGVDAVVHLAGENIASSRWTAERKARILDSRKKGTRLIAEAMAGLDRPPKVLVSASAIGYYGDCGNAVLNED